MINLDLQDLTGILNCLIPVFFQFVMFLVGKYDNLKKQKKAKYEDITSVIINRINDDIYTRFESLVIRSSICIIIGVFISAFMIEMISIFWKGVSYTVLKNLVGSMLITVIFQTIEILKWYPKLIGVDKEGNEKNYTPYITGYITLFDTLLFGVTFVDIYTDIKGEILFLITGVFTALLYLVFSFLVIHKEEKYRYKTIKITTTQCIKPIETEPENVIMTESAIIIKGKENRILNRQYIVEMVATVEN